MKTRLFTRKRALVSSVAMLLVAIIALGTATFAWFTKSSSATAEGINVSTVKASDLKIANSQSGWVDSFSYAFTDILKPASSANGTAWFTAEAAAKNAHTASAANATDISSDVTDWSVKTVNGTGTATDTNKNGYIFKEQLNIQNAGEATIKNVKIKFSLNEAAVNTGKKYLRVAVVPVDTKGGTPTTFANCVYAAGADTADAFTSTAKATTTVTAKSGADATVAVGDLDEDAERYYNIYAWFEGQDEDCYDLNAGNSISGLTFSVVGEASN
ncbi:MAG: hypothetical protein J1F17_02550 [Oscillospiraceae bacterium]|nr:hypothetical protein [Oscillospiraceae bacterium]